MCYNSNTLFLQKTYHTESYATTQENNCEFALSQAYDNGV